MAKQIILILTFLSSIITISAQSVKHIVQKGETLQSIAKKYGISENDIINSNPYTAKYVYTGMQLLIDKPKNENNESLMKFDKDNNALTVLNNSEEIDDVSNEEYIEWTYSRMCSEADEYLNMGKYKKASKLYSKIIKEFNSIFNCKESYYGRAIAYYNRHKWKSAIRDFNTTLSITPKESSIYSHCESLLAKAKKNREEQLSNRGEMFANLFAITAIAATAAASASQTPVTNNAVATSSNSTFGGFNTPSSSSNSYETSSYSSSTSSTPSNSSKSICRTCSGGGKCLSCHGSGFRTDNSFGTGTDYKHKCGVCGGSGICNLCKGTGYK